MVSKACQPCSHDQNLLQGLPLLVGLVEEGGAHDDGALTAIAVPCLSRLLEGPTPALPKPQLCRVLVSLGLGHRLVKSLLGLRLPLPPVGFPLHV